MLVQLWWIYLANKILYCANLHVLKSLCLVGMAPRLYSWSITKCCWVTKAQKIKVSKEYTLFLMTNTSLTTRIELTLQLLPVITCFMCIGCFIYREYKRWSLFRIWRYYPFSQLQLPKNIPSFPQLCSRICLLFITHLKQ